MARQGRRQRQGRSAAGLGGKTAKAIVDIPAPYDGVVVKTFGAEGDLLHVGEPLLAYEGEGEDSGTVVGKLEAGDSAGGDSFFVGAAPSTREHLAPRATPAAAASWRSVWASSWAPWSGSGPDGLITRADIEAAVADSARDSFGGERLRGVRRIGWLYLLIGVLVSAVDIIVAANVITFWEPMQFISPFG